MYIEGSEFIPQIIPITDLRNTNEISDLCHSKNEPIFITKNAYSNKGYRQLFVKNFTIVYRIDEEKKQVIIVTVRYSKCQF